MPSVVRHLRKLCILGLLASPAHAADDWQAVTFISDTVGNHINRLCMGVPDHMRGSDIGCPSFAPSLTTGGHVSITGNVSANSFIGDGSGLTNLNVQGDRITSGSHAVVANENTGSISMTTGGSTWGYFSVGWSRLANLFADTVSSTLVSATHVSSSYVDTTRGGTVSGTYGYFRHISGTYLSGDGSGLYNVPASAVSGLNLDRITSGSHALIANQGTGYVSLTSGGSTWGYLSAGWSRLANLFADTVSSTLVSATHVSASYVDTTRGGTVSGTYGYFRFISGTDIHGRFSGDGSGLTGVTAAASDRIVSGSTGGTRMVAVSETGFISITQAGANSGWFDPTRGLVTLGVSATGSISGTRGYFRETVGIGTLAPVGALHIAGLSHSRSVRLSSDLGAYTELGILNNTASWFDINPHPLTASENSTIRFFRHVSTTGVAEVIFHRADGGGDPVAVIGNTRIALGMNGINVGIGLWSTGARLGVAGTISATDAIQVGNSSLTCGAGIAGALRYSGSKIEYCNGVAWGALVGAAEAMGDRIVSGSTNIIAHQNQSLTFATDNQQRMVIAEDGRVGVGSSAPQGILHVSTPDSTPALFLSRDGDANVSIAFASSLGSSLIDGGGSGGHLRFYTAGQQRMLLNSEGNIVIGSAYAGSSLTIAGEAQVGNSGGACNSAQNAGAIRYTAGNLLFCNNANTWVTLGTAGATTAASSTGAVQFNVNNQLAGDTDNFFWDNANKRLGIGTNAPLADVDVSRTHNGPTVLRVANSSPGGSAYSGVRLDNDAGVAGWFWTAPATSVYEHARDRAVFQTAGGGSGNRGVSIIGGDALHDIRMFAGGYSSSAEALRITPGRRVGIGTQSPTATLQVSGSFIVSTSAQTTTPSMFVASNGSVGFGTSNPLVPFHIAKPQIGGNAIAYIGDFVNGFENNSNGIGFTIFSNGSNYIDLKTFTGGSTYFRTGSGVQTGAARVAMEIAGDTGNVGFGKPAVARVDVSGTISATNAIQVGTSSLTCGAGIAGAIRYETTSNTLQICTGATGWRSLVSGTAGPGATSLADLTDVNLTSLAGRDYLRYDHATSRWVNISESTVMSTTTMVPNWPDALNCSSAAGSASIVNLTTSVAGALRVYGFNAGGSSVGYQIHFNNDGSWNTIINSPGWADVAGCTGKTIAQLYAEGRAFNFIGNSGVSGGSALGDRLTSGTLPHAVTVNSATGVVSLSSAGTTWGYLSSGNSYLPTLLANKVSATNVSATYLQLSSPTTVLACDSGLAGAMRYTSGTMQVCNGTSWGNIGIGVPAGTISAFAAASCPSGWVEYGPARGRFLRGIDNGAGNDPAGTRAPGNTQADELRSHAHTATTDTAGAHSHGIAHGNYGTTGSGTGGMMMSSAIGEVGAYTASAGAHSHAVTVNNTGGAETRPKNVAVIFCSYAGYQSEVVPGISTLGGLSDVSVGGALSGQVLAFDGATWVASNTTATSNALGDRIISGTHAVTVNTASGMVSLSTAGTTWGYLNSIRSYLPALSSEQVSSTNVSATLLQVGTGNGAVCDAARLGAMRYSSVSSTMEYCQGSAWVSMGPSATVPVSFRVTKGGNNQTVPSAHTKLTWSSEVFDSNNNFNADRFTATVPGIYLFNLSAYCSNTTSYCQVTIYKNGSNYATSFPYTSAGEASASVTSLMSLGVGDYVEAFVHPGTGSLISGAPTTTFFEGMLVGPQAGGSGGGSSDLAGLSDVNLSSLAGRDYLRYDAGTNRWVNVPETTVMSTTTMVPGWPDAIQCYGPAGSVSIQLSYSSGSNFTYVSGYTATAATDNLRVSFNAGGTWTSVGNTGVWTGYYETNCNSAATTISSLYAAGRAFNFIGNSGANGGSALGDRITSGTLAVTVNSATGVVSLSTAGTTWGYLNSTRSYLPALSSGQVSSTNVSATLLQVGTGNGAACDAARLGAMRYSSVSSTMEYCQGSAWVSMGPSATAIPAFSVHRNGAAQTGLSQGVFEKVTFTHKKFDTYSNFDIGTGRFTPTVPGTYVLNGDAYCASTDWCGISIYKNGISIKQGWGQGNGSSIETPVNTTEIVQANGTTDYFEMYVWVGGGTALNGSASLTGFSGALISMAGGTGVGGGVADNLGDHTATQDLTMGTHNIVGAGVVSMTNVSATLIQLNSPSTAGGCNSGILGAMRRNGSTGLLEVCQ